MGQLRIVFLQLCYSIACFGKLFEAVGRTPDWSWTSAAGMPWGLNGSRVIERELVGPQDALVGVAHEHEDVTTRARLLVLKPCGVPRAHRESVDVGGGGVRADDLFR